jgi:hypothetical protein
VVVHLRPDFFSQDQIRRRLLQATLAAAISTPIALLTMLAIPVDVSFALQTIYSFLLLTVVIAVLSCLGRWDMPLAY